MSNAWVSPGDRQEWRAMSAAERVSLESVFLETRRDLERVMRRRVQSADVVADLVQDVYMKCRSVMLDFPDRTEARAYLLRMGSNLAIDHQRVEGRRAVILNDLRPYFESLEATGASPESHAIAADKARHIEALLSSLPGLTRQMFILVRVHGLTHKEAADRLGVSKSLVDKYVLLDFLKALASQNPGSVSLTPVLRRVSRMVGHVPSPTPTVATSGDSIRVIRRPEPEAVSCSAASTAAVSQPALPPPRMTTCLIACSTHLPHRRACSRHRSLARVTHEWRSRWPPAAFHAAMARHRTTPPSSLTGSCSAVPACSAGRSGCRRTGCSGGARSGAGLHRSG